MSALYRMDQKLQEGKYRIGCHGTGKLLPFVHTQGIIVSISLRNCFEQFTVNSVARCLKACWLLGTFCFSDMQRRYKGVVGTKLASVLLRHSPNCVSDRTAVWLRRAEEFYISNLDPTSSPTTVSWKATSSVACSSTIYSTAVKA